MAGILAECPVCHRKQAIKNKVCNGDCGADLDREKKARKVRYWIYYMDSGKQKREAVGGYADLDAYSIEDAKDLLSDRRVKKRKKQAFHLPEYDEKTFKELREWYLGLNVVKDSVRDLRGVRIRLENFSTVLGDKVLSGIIPLDLEGYVSKRLRDGVKRITIEAESRNVKTVVKKANENNLVSDSTFKVFSTWKVKVPKSEKARKRSVSIPEHLALVGGAAAHLAPILIVAYHTGMRPGELLALRWIHLDRDNGMILFPRGLTKEGRKEKLSKDSEERKRIPINRYVEEVFKKLPAAFNKNRPVFTYAGREITKSEALRTSINTACRRAGIPYGAKVEGGFVLKDLRKAFATNMESAGVRESYRKTIMGHSLEGMDQHYVDPSDTDLQTAMDQFTAWFDDQLKTIDQIVDHENSSG